MKKIEIGDLVVGVNYNGIDHREGEAGAVLELDLHCHYYTYEPAVCVLWPDGSKLWEPIGLLRVISRQRSK